MAPADCWNCEWGLTENKCKGPFLGCFVGLVLPLQEFFVLPWLLKSAQHEIHFSSPIFQFLCPHRPANWAGRRAGSPVYYCVSLVFFLTLFLMAHWRPVKGGSLDGLPYRLTLRGALMAFRKKSNSWPHNFVEVSGHNLGVLRLEVSVDNVNVTNQKLNSWTYSFVEVTGYNLESSQT